MSHSPWLGEVPVLGIVGGIGSGKSAVARGVAHQLGWKIIDADQLGHEALRQPEIIARLGVTFGPEILTPEGQIDRSRLARRVFGDQAVQKQARRELEHIVHPELERMMREAIAACATEHCGGVVLDAALLFEAGWNNVCDRVAYIDAPESVRQQRVEQQRGWTATQLAAREASQWPLADKMRSASWRIPNTGTLDLAVEALVREVQSWLGSQGSKHVDASGGR